MMQCIRFLTLLGAPLFCGALLAVPASAGTDLSTSGRMIVGLAPDSALAAAYAEGAKGTAEVAQGSPLAVALEDLVGMPIRDILLGSGREISFAPDWQAMGGVEQGDRVVLSVSDLRLANALAERLDPVARKNGGTTIEIDPERTIAAIADRLNAFGPVAYAQPVFILEIDK